MRTSKRCIQRLLFQVFFLCSLLCFACPVHSQEKAVTNSLGMSFVLIPSGSFLMGSPVDEKHRDTSEVEHRVTISRPFYLQTTEVTVNQWRQVMGRRLFAKKKGSDNMPVVKVSWHDCQKFIDTLNQDAAGVYRLPTEAQWEYAARAGSSSAYFWGDEIDCSRALYANNSRKYDTCVLTNRSFGLADGQPAPVKTYDPNAWGLYDMHGNVWEWCQDYYAPYPRARVKDPVGGGSGTKRVRRGGSWFSPGYACRSANRAYGHAMSRLQNTGFRLVLEVE